MNKVPMMIVMTTALLGPVVCWASEAAPCASVDKEVVTVTGVVQESRWATASDYLLKEGTRYEQGTVIFLDKPLCVTFMPLDGPQVPTKAVLNVVNLGFTPAAKITVDARKNQSDHEYDNKYGSNYDNKFVEVIGVVTFEDSPHYATGATLTANSMKELPDGGPERTVVGFYSALSMADGTAATRYVIPEKREKGPFSSVGISQFYSSFREPLALQRIQALPDGKLDVRYRYVGPQGRACDGHALVTTTVVAGRVLISEIHAITGC